jgi:hypothetical protein
MKKSWYMKQRTPAERKAKNNQKLKERLRWTIKEVKGLSKTLLYIAQSIEQQL